MPAPRDIDSDRLYPDDLSDQAYLELFLKQFTNTPQTPFIYTDKIGEPLIISEDLFKTPNGRLKVKKRGRHIYLPLLADTIKNPQEIWWTWEEYPKGRYTLLKRYMTRYQIKGQDVPIFVLFDFNEKGWVGVTAFNADETAYLEKQRKGTLAYREVKK
jgi:hypothetical protein